MNNECGAQYIDATALKHTCQLVRNHEGSHYNYRYPRTWPQSHPYGGYFRGYEPKVVVFDEAQPETVTVKLTLTDLKTIAYYMAEEEDADPTKMKIDEALKEML